MTPATIGVYPDARTSDDGGSGVVAVRDGDVLAAATLRRRGGESPADYLDRVCKTVADIGRSVASAGDRWTVAVRELIDDDGRHTVRRTKGQSTSPIATAYIVGAVLREFRARPVPDHKLLGARHLSKHDGTGKAADYYPSAIVGRRTANGPVRTYETGNNRPLWAAFDVAVTAWEGTR